MVRQASSSVKRSASAPPAQVVSEGEPEVVGLRSAPGTGWSIPASPSRRPSSA